MSGELFGGAARSSPVTGGSGQTPQAALYRQQQPPPSPVMDEQERARPRPRGRPPSRGAQREPRGLDSADADYVPVREAAELGPSRRDRSLDRADDEGLYIPGNGQPAARPGRHSPSADFSSKHGLTRDTYILELQAQNSDFQRELSQLKRELDLTAQKLGSSMHSIKTFWSPELKKERQLRKEESAKYSLMSEQIQLLTAENQKQVGLIRQLEDELHRRGGKNQAVVELQQQLDQFYVENDHLSRENAILKETVKELELRIEAQKQTLLTRDESIKKLLEMLQHKGLGGKELPQECLANMRTQTDLAEAEARIAHLVSVLGERDVELDSARQELDSYIDQYRVLQTEIRQKLSQNPTTLTGILEVKDRRIEALELEVSRLDAELVKAQELSSWEPRGSSNSPRLPTDCETEKKMLKDKFEDARGEIQKRDQEILALTAKLKTLEEQHHDYQRHITVLKESLCAKEEHYNMLQADVEELRQRLEEKNRTIDKKTQSALQASQERNRLSGELNEVRDHLDIKERKINVLQRKLDLQEAHQKMSTGVAGDDSALQRRLEELQQLTQQKDQQLQRQAGEIDDTSRQLEDRDRQLQLLEARVQQLQEQPSGEGGDELATLRAELQQLREEHSRAQSQSERLLHLMQISQQEQDAKDRTINELQQALKRSRGPPATAPSSAAQSRASTPGAGSHPKADDEAARLRRELMTQEAELARRGERLAALEADVASLEAELEQAGRLPELEQMVALVKEKASRCQELELALSSAARLADDREAALHDEADKQAELGEKMKELERRLEAMQESANMSCASCGPLRKRLQAAESRLRQLTSERRRHLEELFDLKQEALASAVSEKDAHLALLEVSGIRNARTAEQANTLISEKQKLVERMRQENECRVQLLSECADPDVTSLPSSGGASTRHSPASS